MHPYSGLAEPMRRPFSLLRAHDRSRLRPVRLLLAVIAAPVVLAVLPPAPASASLATEAAALVAINTTRAEHGLSPLTLNVELRAAARRHSARMILENRLFHSDLGDLSGRWVAENVAYGGTVDDIHAAFLQSSPHRANILDADMTQVGVAVDYDNGYRWVTMIFRQPR